MRSTGRRGALLAALAALVAALHLDLLGRLAVLLPDAEPPPIERLQAAFVRELAPAAPPAPAAAAPPPPRRPGRRAAAPPVAPVAPASAPDEPAQAAPAEPPIEPPPEASSAPRPDEAAEAPAAPAEAASAPPFEWPLSTRLRYTLSGDVRGPVEGHASVEWLRESDRYQVQLEVIVGPSFAPLMQRRMLSDGLIGAAGLMPRRYEEETRIAFAPTRRSAVSFDGEEVALANGRRLPALPGLQDTASQFVQLTWLFATGAVPLRAGAEIRVPLALPRRVDGWIYDVIGEELLATPFGTVPAWHLKPRREGTPSTLSIETWFAPSLQYLPVRIVIRQEPDNHIDLMIERLPQQAAP